MVRRRLRAVLTTLVPILNRTRGSLAAFASAENSPHHHRNSNPAAFFTLGRFSLMESSTSSSRRQHGSNGNGKGKASARSSSSSVPQRRLHKRSLDAASEGGSGAGRRVFSTLKRPATQLGAGAAGAAGEAAGLTMDDAREALRSLFGHDDFRDGQVRCRTIPAAGCTRARTRTTCCWLVFSEHEFTGTSALLAGIIHMSHSAVI